MLYSIRIKILIDCNSFSHIRGFVNFFSRKVNGFQKHKKHFELSFPAVEGQIEEAEKISLAVAQFAVCFYKYELVLTTSTLSKEVCLDHKAA